MRKRRFTEEQVITREAAAPPFRRREHDLMQISRSRCWLAPCRLVGTGPVALVLVKRL